MISVRIHLGNAIHSLKVTRIISAHNPLGRIDYLDRLKLWNWEVQSNHMFRLMGTHTCGKQQ